MLQLQATMQPFRSSFGLCAIVAILSAYLSDAYSFLFISAPSSDAVYASQILTATEQSRNEKMSSYKLPGIEAIKEPRGVAVDSLRKILYIVDGSGVLHAARIYYSNQGTVACNAPKKIIEGLTSRWVAVDFRGKVFVSIDKDIVSIKGSAVTNKLDNDSLNLLAEPEEVLSTPAPAPEEVTTVAPTTVAPAPAPENQETDTDADPATTTTTTAVVTTTVTTTVVKDEEVLYDDSIAGVSSPGGIAVDGYRLFWANGENGEQDGTVVQGFEEPLGSTTLNQLAKNLALAHGICLSPQRVFYADEESNFFSIKVNGGEVATITDKLQKPRGCVFDGDGTVFVADHGDDKILSFAGAGADLGPRKLTISLSGIKEPYGLAILHGDRDHLQKGASHSAGLVLALVVTMASFTL